MKIGDKVRVRNSVLVSHGQYARVVDVVAKEEMVLVNFLKPGATAHDPVEQQWFLEEDLSIVCS